MFTMQLKLKLDSPLGQRIPLMQHLFAVAIVNAVLSQDGYQVSSGFYIVKTKYFTYFIEINLLKQRIIGTIRKTLKKVYGQI